MVNQADRPGIIAPPPLLTLAAILAGCSVDRFSRAPIAPNTGAALRIALSVTVLVAAAVVFLAAVTALHRQHTTPNPYQPTTAVVSSGIYRFSRNPIYLGFMLIVLAVAIAANSWWLLVALVALFLTLRFGVVAREERYLSAKFGADYDSYRDRVRRWL
jgi:protein-S-isoprenylcysteine O-methyltransferase Ste14